MSACRNGGLHLDFIVRRCMLVHNNARNLAMDRAMTNTIRGRSQLSVWMNGKPDNFFTADGNLQNVLHFYLNSAYAVLEPTLLAFGGQAATCIDEAAKVEDQLGNHPRLQRWSGIGERTEGIEFHPNHDRIGHLVW